jgi:hypothetical protein
VFRGGTAPAFLSDVRFILILVCLVVGTACEKHPVGPTVPFDEPFTLAPGESATFDGVRLVVRFTGVSGDSRCPADAICIQGGDAIVHVRVSAGVTDTYELHTGDSARAAVTHGSFRISLLDLQPHPFSSRAIDQDDYRATLSVARE